MENITDSNAPVFQDLRYDIGFKNTFGNPNHKNLLIGLLNTILKLPNPIIDFSYLPYEANSFGRDGKRSVCDVRCRLSTGEHIIIEVQLRPEQIFNERVLFEACAEIAAQPKRSKERHQTAYKLEPVYVVAIVHFKRRHTKYSLNHHNGFIWKYSIREDNNAELFSPTLNFCIVELDNFSKNLSELGTFEEKVYFCLKWMGDLTSKPSELTEDFFEELFDVTRFEALSSEQRIQYLRNMELEEKYERWKEYAIEELREEGREIGIEQGIKQGREIGIEQGIKQGREIGIEQGIEQGIKKSSEEIAKRMLGLGMDIETISQCTNLSIEQIETLKSE